MERGRSEKHRAGGRLFSVAAAQVSGDHVFLLERILLGRPVSQDPRSPQLGDST